MKFLLNRSQVSLKNWCWNEQPESEVVAPATAPEAPVEVDVPAAAAAVGERGVTLTADDLPPDPEIQAEARAIVADASQVAAVVEGNPNGTLTGAETLPPTAAAQAAALQNAELAALNTQIEAAQANGDTALLAQLNAQREALETNRGPLTETLENMSDNMTPREFLEAFARMMQGGETATSSPRGRSDIHGGTSSTLDSLPNGAASEMFAHCESVAQQLGVETAAVKAVVEVESAGQMNATRFEPHIHARYSNEPEPRRTQLATSYGAFQIMGFNHQVCGFSSPQAMIDAMATPQGQLQAFAGFIEGNPRIHNALRSRDWATFAHGYNGPAYAQNNYDQKMAAAYQRHSRN